MNNIRVFLSENFQFLEVKFSIYLNRCVFVMCSHFAMDDIYFRQEFASIAFEAWFYFPFDHVNVCFNGNHKHFKGGNMLKTRACFFFFLSFFQSNFFLPFRVATVGKG